MIDVTRRGEKERRKPFFFVGPIVAAAAAGTLRKMAFSTGTLRKMPLCMTK
jgi:hypothetical protein